MIAGGAIVTILPISRSGFVATAGLAVFGATAAAARWQAGARVRRHGVGLLLAGACVIAAVGLLALAAGLSGDGAVAVLVGCAVGRCRLWRHAIADARVGVRPGGA